MPCDTIQTATVELGKVNEDLLAAAMKELGYKYYTYANGKVTVSGGYVSGEELAKVKQMYSKQVVMSQAKKFGWQVKQVAPMKWEVQR
jgi:hypothetical protein